MRKFISNLLILIGFLTIIFGGIFLLVNEVIHLVQEGSKLSGFEIFGSIMIMILRDFLAIIIGGVIALIGYFISPNENAIQKRIL